MERADEFGEFFTYVRSLVDSYQGKRYGEFLEFLGRSGFSISSQADKTKIAKEMSALVDVLVAGTVGNVVDMVTASSLIPRSRRLIRLQDQLAADPSGDSESFVKRRPFVVAVLAVPWTQVDKFLDYADQHTPFSTKHGVKGAEFENVLVIIDDSLWNQYKFAQVFTSDNSNSGRLERSRKLLYVCFSRSMNGLAVLYLGTPTVAELAGAKDLLGVSQVVNVA